MKKFKVYVSEYIRHETEVIILAENEEELSDVLQEVNEMRNGDFQDYIHNLRKLLKDKNCTIVEIEEEWMVEPFEDAEYTDIIEDNSEESDDE